MFYGSHLLEYVYEGQRHLMCDDYASASMKDSNFSWAFVFCLVLNECSNEYFNDYVIYTPFHIHSMSRFNFIETQPTTGFELKLISGIGELCTVHIRTLYTLYGAI